MTNRCIVMTLVCSAGVASGPVNAADRAGVVTPPRSGTVVELGETTVTLPDGRELAARIGRVWKPTCTDGRARAVDAAAFEARRAAHTKPGAVIAASDAERAGLNIVFNLFGDINAQNTAGLQDVADYFADVIQDDITITIDVFLDPDNFGGTGGEFIEVGYETWRQALIADMDPDDSVEALLPATALPVQFVFGGAVSQEDTVIVFAANARAVGIDPGVPVDASIFVGSELDWDPSDGIGQPGQWGDYSGQDIMVHEVGHAIGFVNMVEFGETLPTTLDAYRFAEVGANNPASDAEFTSFPRALYVGSFDANQQHVFDVRSGEYLASNASNYQASHFRENFSATPVGRMDPAIANTETSGPDYLFESDRAAFDAIGWDLFDGVACFADCDGNALLNVDDIDCFVAAFVGGDLGAADCDGNAVLNVDDVDCFVASFLGGCP